MRMTIRTTLINVMLQVACVLAAGAQVQEPCGVYEAADKVDGLTRQGYMEINIKEPAVPDFRRHSSRVPPTTSVFCLQTS